MVKKKDEVIIMSEWSPYDLSDFTYDVLCLYIKYGYGCVKMYNTSFFQSLDDESVLLTIEEFKDKVDEYRKNNLSEETTDE